MKFLLTWTIAQATYPELAARFLKDGAPPPPGVKMLGRWHGMSGAGCAIVEADDPKALYAWYCQWIAVLPVQTTPLVEDGDAGEVLAKLYKDKQ